MAKHSKHSNLEYYLLCIYLHSSQVLNSGECFQNASKNSASRWIFSLLIGLPASTLPSPPSSIWRAGELSDYRKKSEESMAILCIARLTTNAKRVCPELMIE